MTSLEVQAMSDYCSVIPSSHYLYIFRGQSLLPGYLGYSVRINSMKRIYFQDVELFNALLNYAANLFLMSICFFMNNLIDICVTVAWCRAILYYRIDFMLVARRLGALRTR